MLASLRHVRLSPRCLVSWASRRSLITLAIETSCDDTSVAVLEKHDAHVPDNGQFNVNGANVKLHFHEKITSDNLAYRGVHPIIALESHEQNLALLVKQALKCHSTYDAVFKPDFVSVTRGPGMRSNLSTGLNTAKGLAIAWEVPLVAVNHMQAHALTPRLVSALSMTRTAELQPQFPFLSLLVSGGHTMLIHSKSLTEHPTIVQTVDIAIGDAIDKIAREVLDETVLRDAKSTMYGPVLEQFAFQDGNYDYKPPKTRDVELTRRITRWGWGFGPPLAATKSGAKSKALEYSFTGLCSAAARIVKERSKVLSEEERRDLAREAMRVAFEHLASRVVLWLNATQKRDPKLLESLNTLVVSGGVAANEYLRHILRAFLDVRDYSHIQLSFPPPNLCTDNAAMIAWTGIEMFEAGYRSSLSCHALRKWSLDPGAEDGGILGVSGWERVGSQGKDI